MALARLNTCSTTAQAPNPNGTGTPVAQPKWVRKIFLTRPDFLSIPGQMAQTSLLQLSSRARTTLEELARNDPDGRAVRRAQALLWLDAGEPVGQVAGRLQVSRQMLYSLVARYETRRDLAVVARVRDGAHTGRPATKREQVAEAVVGLLAQAPSEYGYHAPTWTTPMFRSQLERQHHLVASEDTIQRALHASGYRYKRPRYSLARRDVHWRQAKGGSKAA